MLTKLLIVLLACTRINAESTTNEGSLHFNFEEILEQEAKLKSIGEEINLIKNEILSEHEKKTLKKEHYLHVLRLALLEVYPTLCLPVESATETQNIKLGYETVEVACNGEFDGPGWTLIQRRTDDSLNFHRDWFDYEHGFGSINGSYFIGLEKLYQLTDQKQHELYIQLENRDGETRYAKYDNFKITYVDYQLSSLGDYTGTAGDALSGSLGKSFTTDYYGPNRNGWWTGSRLSGKESNLNAPYIQWKSWPTDFKSAQMFVRPLLKCKRKHWWWFWC